METLAHRFAPLVCHIQIYAQGEQLEALAPRLPKLPIEVVIDHCGVDGRPRSQPPQFQALVRRLDSGRAWIKTSSYRMSSAGAPWCDAEPNVKAIVGAAP